MTKYSLLAFLILPFLIVGTAHAQGVSVNQQGDVIYLGTTTTTAPVVTPTPTPVATIVPSPNTVTFEAPPAVRMNNSMVLR